MPLPKSLFTSIPKYQCTLLLSNPAALRLMLKIGEAHRLDLPSINTVFLTGDRIPQELLNAIAKQLNNCKRVVGGFLLTETASFPLLSDETTNLTKAVGKVISGHKLRILGLDGKEAGPGQLGELQIQPIDRSMFLGYHPQNNDDVEWISTGDIAMIDSRGNVELVTNRDDLIRNGKGELIEHWTIERVLSSHDDVKGAQLVRARPELPLTAVIVPKNDGVDGKTMSATLISHCRNNQLSIVPEKFVFIADFPRVNTKIQKYRLREMLLSGEIK